MRRIIPLLMLTALVLAGCSSTGEVENQAYALVLGVETSAGGGVALTIRIPRIGKTSGDAGDEPYLVISAEGDGYAQALEHLQWAVARELNLSHLKLIVVSREMAASEDFPGLIRAIAETRHLYTTAGFVVCEGSAKAFIEGQETILGTRLSSEITAMFQHYARHGYIAHATFADLYYATLSGGSDPTGIWGYLDPSEPTGDAEAAALIGDGDALRQGAQTASARQYLGAAVFRDGRLAQVLDADDTLYLNLLTQKLDGFTFAVDDRAYTFACARRPRRRVAVRDGVVAVSATVWLTCEDAASRSELDAAEAAISQTLEAMIRRCQQSGLEPFGFTDRAAAQFPTLGAWERFHWRERFPAASVEVRVHIG